MEWAKAVNQKGLDVYEKYISETAGKYSIGDEVTLADAFIIPQMYNAKRFELDLTQWPTIQKVLANLNELPEIQKADAVN